MARIRQIARQAEWNADEQKIVDADAVRVVVDLYDNASHLEILLLAFADYEGLEAEWTAGESTAVLGAAIAEELGDAHGDSLTESQRGAVGIVIAEG